MHKILNIARKDIYTTFTDRSLLLLMFVTPLALASIIAFAFSDLGGGSSPIANIPVALVNLDAGDGEAGFNGGAIFVAGLVPSAENDGSQSNALGTCTLTQATASTDDADDSAQFSLTDLTDTTLLSTREEALLGVDNGVYAAAIIIPENFTRAVSYSRENGFSGEQVAVEVYGNAGSPISASVIRSVAERFTNQIVNGNIAIGATIETMTARAVDDPEFGQAFLTANSEGTFNPDFSCAFDFDLNTVGIETRTLAGEETEDVNFLVVLGSAQAVFFALFTASGAAGSIIEERREGTLQRLFVSPTSRIEILLGKLIGTVATVLLQLIFLFIGFTFINTLLEGEFSMIWGDNALAIAGLIIVTALATSGVGMITAAVAKTAEQASIIGSVVGMFMGVTGGAFFELDVIPGIEPITRLSIVFWGSDGFTKLADGDSDIVVNLLILIVLGLGLFMVSLMLFNRRQDI